MRGGWNVRVGVTGLVHAKLLRLSSGALAAASGGKVANLISNDVSKFDLFATAIHFGWSGLLDLVAVSVLLYFIVGWLPMVAGVAVPVLCLPLQIYLGRRFGIQRKVTASRSDTRIQAASEAFLGMELVKLQGWERALFDRIDQFRTLERKSIFISQALKAVNLSLYFCSPALATLATFTVYWAQGNHLDEGTVIGTLSLLHVLRLSIGKNFARFVETFPEVKVSLSRLRAFLLEAEVETSAGDEANPAATAVMAQPDGHSIEFVEATIAWSTVPDEFAIRGLEMSVPAGALTIVTGAVGAGKSALLLGILGEMSLLRGSRAVRQSPIGYAAQQPWIFAASIRDNILFGEPFDKARYWAVLAACGLETDIDSLADGDMTEIGDKGVNLSGGQRARVSLARVAYSRAPLCLLDDPLAALDTVVGEHVMQQCLKRLLCDRTVILTTHHTSLASQCDLQLKLTEPSQRSPPVFGPPAEQDDSQDDSQVEPAAEPSVADDEEVTEQAQSERLTLVMPEDRQIGDVELRTYWDYIKFGGVCRAVTVLVLFLLGQCCIVAADVWLQIWQEQDDQNDPYLYYTFLGLCIAAVITALIRSVVFFAATLLASSNMHSTSLWAVLNAPLHFFTSNPHGRIMNKFASDQGQVDEVLPVVLFDAFQIGFMVFGSLCVVCAAIPWLLIMIPGLIYGFWRVRRRFLISCREIKRMESITKSPIFSTFAENLAGLLTIRAFGQQLRLQARFEELLMTNGTAWHAWLLVNRWIGVRLDLLSFCVTLGCGAMVVGLKDQLDAALASLALVYCINLSGMFQYMVRQTAQVETMMTSVERILNYAATPSEESSPPPAGTVADNWPPTGEIKVESLEVRYRDDLPMVLKGVDLLVPAGSSCGVVGRTGSGKSSLAAALLRLNQVVAGRVLVDGVDLSSVPLASFRNRISFIPQVPNLFSGTLRFNLDPFGKHADEDLWQVLQAVQLTQFVLNQPDGLGMPVAEAGKNLSVGQRQLISLARSMIARNRIVIMDECTANVDLETDQLVQQAMFGGQMFQGATVIVIAHRIDTIINCDQVLVLESGKVVESGSPSLLRSKPGGVFAEMVGKSSLAAQEAQLVVPEQTAPAITEEEAAAAQRETEEAAAAKQKATEDEAAAAAAEQKAAEEAPAKKQLEPAVAESEN